MEKLASFLLSVIILIGQMLSIIDPSITNHREGYYNYCPSVIQTDDKTRYVYYCTNREPFDVTDHIGMRVGTRGIGGKYRWSEEKIVLAPTLAGWDGHHTCDPSVICGEFGYNGKSYKYLMAYLGCTSRDSQDNKIGLAVSNSPDGEFIKVGSEPFIDYIHDYEISSDIFQWGVGQPSLVNINQKSRITMFYTRGDKYGTRTQYVTFDGSDLSSIEIISSGTVTNSGLKNLKNENDYLNNADFALNRSGDAFVAVSDCHPYPANTPSHISDTFRVTSIAADGLSEGRWTDICEVGRKQTHFARNHDCCFVRDEYGRLPEGNTLTAYYTVAVENTDAWLWSFRIYEHGIKTS